MAFRYRVTAAGFYGGITYNPKGNRNILHVEKKFKKVPSWLELMKSETAKEKKARVEDESTSSENDAEQAESDKVEKDAVTFTEGPKSTVQTL